jgi:hypothetical protein
MDVAVLNTGRIACSCSETQTNRQQPGKRIG